MFENHLIEDGSLTTDGHGFGFMLRLNWYRALPLSSIDLAVCVDGEQVDGADVTFAVDGETYALADLPTRHDRMWFVADPAEIRARRDGGLAPGAHELSVTLRSRIPYIPTRGTDVLLQEDTCTKTVSV